MTNAALMHQALEYRRLKAAAAELEAQAKVHNDAVVAEMARRKLEEPFTHKGLVVTVVAQKRTKYRVDAAKAILPRATFARVTKLVIDNTAVAAEIKAGRIDPEALAPAADVTTASAYILVTGDAA